MKTGLFWFVALFAAAFNLFSLYDLYGATTNFEEHVAGYPPAFIEMIANFPEWRRILWATTVFIGVIGAGALLLRRSLAERALWAATILLILAVILDYTMLDGAVGYAHTGIGFNLLIVAIEALFALYAGYARRQGMLR